MLKRIADGTISTRPQRSVRRMWEAKSDDDNLVDAIIDAKGLKQISDTGALEAIVDEVLATTPSRWSSTAPARKRPSTP
jgi:aspartyl-tRNA(Asn)/glutamyl-tRNA(Gln) amidotransferase subunit B